jgi:hypothetical protein
MVGLRVADMRFRPTEFLDFTSLTVEELQVLIPPFEAAFQAHMAMWCLDGTPRTARRFSVYQTCPLATPEDRLFFLLSRGRGPGCPGPPAQIPACGFPAPGSCRRSSAIEVRGLGGPCTSDP